MQFFGDSSLPLASFTCSARLLPNLVDWDEEELRNIWGVVTQFTLSHVVHGLGIAFGHFITSSTTTKQWLPYIAQKFKHASRSGKFLTNCNYDKDYYCMDLIIIFYYSYDKYSFYLFFFSMLRILIEWKERARYASVSIHFLSLPLKMLQ